jgi:excisionase family DNA binding protein
VKDEMSEKLLTPDDAAELLQVSPGTVRGWLRRGVIKGTKVGGGRLWRISESTINEFVEASQGYFNQQPARK